MSGYDTYILFNFYSNPVRELLCFLLDSFFFQLRFVPLVTFSLHLQSLHFNFSEVYVSPLYFDFLCVVRCHCQTLKKFLRRAFL